MTQVAGATVCLPFGETIEARFMRRTRSAFTLTEVLVVIAIIAFLAGLLFPVFARARLASKRTVCASNMRQAVMALNLYVETSEEYPMRLGRFAKDKDWLYKAVSPLTGTIGRAPTTVFRCPLDRPEGRGGLGGLLGDAREPQSYLATWLFWGGKSGLEAWHTLEAVEQNPILFRCAFHDDEIRPLLLKGTGISDFGLSFSNGHVIQVARKDGSVSIDRRPVFHEAGPPYGWDIKRTYWDAASAQPCPESVCDGKWPEDLVVTAG